jgi:hypothetical protein
LAGFSLIAKYARKGPQIEDEDAAPADGSEGEQAQPA